MSPWEIFKVTFFLIVIAFFGIIFVAMTLYSDEYLLYKSGSFFRSRQRIRSVNQIKAAINEYRAGHVNSAINHLRKAYKIGKKWIEWTSSSVNDNIFCLLATISDLSETGGTQYTLMRSETLDLGRLLLSVCTEPVVEEGTEEQYSATKTTFNTMVALCTPDTPTGNFNDVGSFAIYDKEEYLKTYIRRYKYIRDLEHPCINDIEKIHWANIPYTKVTIEEETQDTQDTKGIKVWKINKYDRNQLELLTKNDDFITFTAGALPGKNINKPSEIEEATKCQVCVCGQILTLRKTKMA